MSDVSAGLKIIENLVSKYWSLKRGEPCVGEMVTILGLAKRIDLNEKRAVVKSFVSDSGRYELETYHTAESIAVRRINLDLSEALAACERKVAMEYLTQAARVSKEALEKHQGLERMGILNTCLLLVRHASFYLPSCPDAQALCGFFLYQRGMVAEALYEIASACFKKDRKWMYPGTASIMKENLRPVLEQARPMLLRGCWKKIEGQSPEARFFSAYCQDHQTMYVFGGEGQKRKTLGDLWALKLDTLEWTQMGSSGKLKRTKAVMWLRRSD